MYVDSPLAKKITEAYLAHPEYFAPKIRERVLSGEHIFSFPELRLVESVEESQKIADTPGPKIIIAGSGMSSGGRVHGHEKVFLKDPKSTLLIVGYQAAGSLGRRLLEGDKHIVLMGEQISVRAKVRAIYGYSAHMDGEQLLEFVNKAQGTLRHVFVVMGEPKSAMFLMQKLRDNLGIEASAPELGESISLSC